MFDPFCFRRGTDGGASSLHQCHSNAPNGSRKPMCSLTTRLPRYSSLSRDVDARSPNSMLNAKRRHWPPALAIGFRTLRRHLARLGDTPVDKGYPPIDVAESLLVFDLGPAIDPGLRQLQRVGSRGRWARCRRLRMGCCCSGCSRCISGAGGGWSRPLARGVVPPVQPARPRPSNSVAIRIGPPNFVERRYRPYTRCGK